MNLSEVWKLISHNPGIATGIAIVLMSFIEVSKIKINPWSAIGRLFGKFLGIKDVSNKVDALEKKVDENQATTIRVRILRFQNEQEEGWTASKDSWNQVMDDIRRYELYTETHPDFKNNITDATIQHLKKRYAELLEQRTWTTKLTSEESEYRRSITHD